MRGGRGRRRGGKFGFVMAVLGACLAALPAGAAPYEPQVGDELRYGISNGDVAITRVIRTRGHGERTFAQVIQTLLRKGEDPEMSRFTMIRTAEGMAIQVSSAAEGVQLSPLVYYLQAAGDRDSWVAQKGSYRDSEGKEVGYELTAELQGRETVTVKAGKFEDCARIAYRTKLAGVAQGAGSELVFWVKPEIGIIKTRSLQEGKVTETELLSIQRATLPRP
ncbi:hypothetical protein D3C72_202470 [compost metagenome]